MKRVHDYEDSEPDTTGPSGGQEPAAKGKASRKRKTHVTVSGASQMKRTGSSQARTQNLTVTKSQANHFGALMNAQLRHEVLQAQLAQQFPRMNPQDVDSYHAMSVQVRELQALAQEIRQLKTAQVAVYSG